VILFFWALYCCLTVPAAAAAADDDAGKGRLAVTLASSVTAAGVAAVDHLAGLCHLVMRLHAAADAVAHW